MIIFVNGKIGMGSPPMGEKYWHSVGENYSFINGAKDFFKDDRVHFVSRDFPFLSFHSNRYSKGKSEAGKLLDSIPELNEEGIFHFVTHSMGASYAEGMISFLADKGHPVGKVVHINAFQAGRIKISRETRLQTIDFQLTDDPVINNFILRLLFFSDPGRIRGADVIIHHGSGINDFRYIHRSPISRDGRKFWDKLKGRIS